ncbi:uncharacterized protein [Rutidosis leptorrhynchoides]|uniref:uncharacterized protein isoform X1 n=1 Tax=Rutidosis leptorrhynchoides TaxID=125765 RepID=UPI003A99350F
MHRKIMDTHDSSVYQHPAGVTLNNDVLKGGNPQIVNNTVLNTPSPNTATVNSDIANSSANVNVVHTINMDKNVNNEKVSYANIVNKEAKSIDRKLSFVPTAVDKEGNEVVIFDEEFVAESSVKWENTACGYFVGYDMTYGALQYNLRRMWGRFGLRDIIMDNNQMCYFKFNSIDGLTQVVEQSPWMVNGKPILVYKWNPDI